MPGLQNQSWCFRKSRRKGEKKNEKRDTINKEREGHRRSILSPVRCFYFSDLSRSTSESIFSDLFVIMFLIEVLWPQMSLQAM